MKQRTNVPNVTFYNCGIDFWNFSGDGRQERGFTLSITDEEFATQLRDMGWGIKAIANSDAEINRLTAAGWTKIKLVPKVSFTKFSMPVKIEFDPPTTKISPAEITTYSGKKATRITKETCKELDGMVGKFERVDVEVRPRWWMDDDGEWYIKAYLDNMHIVLKRSELREKYAQYMSDEG